ncbi:MAG TPA: DUF309 domain-containing protein [Chloroflexota bacterium]|nr:DUF309 domain-containing protein [Chloroflexota bacterium]
MTRDDWTVRRDASARPEDSYALCAETPPPQLITGIWQFNRREFFACHETLERLWLAECAPVRDLYQGILQIGVAFYHLLRGNYRGAHVSLRRGITRLRPLPPVCRGVQVARLVEDAEAAHAALVARGAAGLARFDLELIPTIDIAPSA